MKKNEPGIRLAVIDDHKLFRKGLINLINSFGDSYQIMLEANNGAEFLDLLKKEQLPGLVIMDINMPVMNGFDLAAELKKSYPQIKMLVITMVEEEQSLIRMLRLGIHGYLNKDVEPDELKEAINTILQKGYYYTDYLTGRLIHAIQEPQEDKKAPLLNDRETDFLKLACSEYTYKEIADIMCLSIKTIDGYRNSLFEKLQAKSRVGLVLYAIKNNLVVIQ